MLYQFCIPGNIDHILIQMALCESLLNIVIYNRIYMKYILYTDNTTKAKQ